MSLLCSGFALRDNTGMTPKLPPCMLLCSLGSEQ